MATGEGTSALIVLQPLVTSKCLLATPHPASPVSALAPKGAAKEALIAAVAAFIHATKTLPYVYISPSLMKYLPAVTETSSTLQSTILKTAGYSTVNISKAAPLLFSFEVTPPKSIRCPLFFTAIDVSDASKGVELHIHHESAFQNLYLLHTELRFHPKSIALSAPALTTWGILRDAALTTNHHRVVSHHGEHSVLTIEEARQVPQALKQPYLVYTTLLPLLQDSLPDI